MIRATITLAVIFIGVLGISLSTSRTASAQAPTAQDICIARWVWNDANLDLPYWQAPYFVNMTGSIDLRSIPQMSLAGGVAQGWGLFAYDSAMGSTGMHCLGSDLDASLTTPQADTIAVMLGKPMGSIGGRNMRDIIRELLTSDADPSGLTFMKPVQSSPRRGLQIEIGGYGTIVGERFSRSSAAFTATLAVRRLDYTRMRGEGVRLEVLRRWNGYDLLRYFNDRAGTNLSQLVPAEFLGDGFRAPETTVTDNFNRANETPLASPWTHDNGSANLVSNQYDPTSIEAVTRHTTSLSSDDNYAEAAIINTPGSWAGPLTRKIASTTLTYYATLKQSGGSGVVQRFQRVAGTYTQVGSNSADTFTTGDIYQIRTDGSSIEYWKNGSFVVATTNTAITGNLQHGIVTADAAQLLDDYEASDLAVAARRVIRIN